ncbi:MAG: DUF1499 domain-containing protein [Pseudomonadota bacterium]
MLKTSIVIAIFAVIGLGTFVRMNPIRAEAVHVDPETVERPSYPGHVLVRPGGDVEPERFPDAPGDLAKRLNTIILDTPRTYLLAGDLEDGWATYVTRSRLWGFPDFASVKLIEKSGETEVLIFSRLRYGYADLGVNKTRVESWLSQL